MPVKSKPKFNIVENYSPDIDFNEFEEDFLARMSKKDLMEKYDLSEGYWKQYRDMVYENHPNIQRRTGGRLPSIKTRYKVTDETGSHIKRSMNGNYTIYRKIGRSYRSYGSYRTRDIAEMVRGELVEYNWNKYVAYDLIKEYAMLVSRRCLLSRILERES